MNHRCLRLNHFNGVLVSITLAVLSLTTPLAAAGDVVTEWNEHTRNAIATAKTQAPITGRVLAIVHAAIFDAVNGIERRYTAYHVDFEAPRGASRRAAAIQAAYGTLVKLFPSQQSTFDLARTASLASTTDDGDVADSESILL